MGVQRMKQKMWLDNIRACKNSGMTVKQFCEDNGLSEKKYWYYHKRLGDELEECIDTSDEILPAKVPTRFAEVNIIDSPKAPISTAVITAGSVHVEVNERTSDELLVKILRAMKNA